MESLRTNFCEFSVWCGVSFPRFAAAGEVASLVQGDFSSVGVRVVARVERA